MVSQATKSQTSARAENERIKMQNTKSVGPASAQQNSKVLARSLSPGYADLVFPIEDSKVAPFYTMRPVISNLESHSEPSEAHSTDKLVPFQPALGPAVLSSVAEDSDDHHMLESEQTKLPLDTIVNEENMDIIPTSKYHTF